MNNVNSKQARVSFEDWFQEMVLDPYDCKILASGYQKNSPYRNAKIWWVVNEGRYDRFQLGMGKVTRLGNSEFEHSVNIIDYSDYRVHNPPMDVRHMIVEKGLAVRGVFEPGVTDPRFALMMRDDLLVAVITALKTRDDDFLQDALQSLPETVGEMVSDYVEAFGLPNQNLDLPNVAQEQLVV